MALRNVLPLRLWVISLCAVMTLSACGLRPSLNELETPSGETTQAAALEEPAPTVSLEDENDAPEPVAAQKEDGSFFLDFLL